MINQDITEQALFTALGAAISPIIGQEVIKGLSNRVAPPNGDYIVVNPVTQTRFGTNETSYTEGFRNESIQYDYVIQIDAYGINSGNTINVLNMLFRSDYFDPSGIVPFYTSSPRQLMLEDSARLMVERWTMDVHVSYNPKIVLPQESAQEAILSIIENVMQL